MVRPRRHRRRAARPPRAPTPPPAAPSAPPRGRLARILRLAERIAAFVQAGGWRVLRWLVAAWLRRLVRCAGDAGRMMKADQDGAEVVEAVPVQEESTTAVPLVEESGPGEERATAVAPKADPFEDGYALAELFEDGADEHGEDPTARVQERAPGATPVSKRGRANDSDARSPREDAGGSDPSGNVSSAKAPRFPREERRKHGEDAVAGNPSAAKEEGRGRESSSASTPRHQEEDERERGEASGANNTGRGHPTSSSPRAALGVHHENGELGEGGATASPTAREVCGRVEGKNANTAATDDRGDSDGANSIATAGPGEGRDPASPTTRPVRDRDAASTGTRDIASTSTRDAASAAAGADRATAEPIPVNQKAQERGGTHAGALDTPAGDSDVVRVQPHFAASPAAGASGEASGSRTRRRKRFVPRKKNKKAKRSPLLIEVHQWEKDDVSEKEINPEIHMHQTYKEKDAACRKGYTYCLMCHLENRETKLAKDQNVVRHHCETEHQCRRGGIVCQKRGCFVRAKNNRDIGLHRYVCHNLP